MAVACIDIGSNTTRLLVVEPEGEALRELAAERVFTRIGRSLFGGRIPAAKIAETAGVVARQADRARELGASRLAVVATAAVREARNPAELTAAVERAAGLPVRVLSPDEEARLAFAGATHALDGPVAGDLAVVDVGGGSTEVAVGTVKGGVTWCRSFGVGSGGLAEAHLRSDPPVERELQALSADVHDALRELQAPAPLATAVAVGGSATSLRGVVGDRLAPESFARAIAEVTSAPREQVAARFGLDPERVRLLPAGIAILAEVERRLGTPLGICNGGLREGVVLELAGRS